MVHRTSATDDRYLTFLGVILVAHLVANGVHTIAHLEIPVTLGIAQNILVVLIYLVLPVVGFVLLWSGSTRVGVTVFTVSMASAFLHGVYLHFLLPNPDHVSSVPSGPWQLPFQLSAVAFTVTTAVGTALGAWRWRDLDARGRGALPRSGRIAGVPDSGFRPLTRLSYWISRRWFGEIPEPLTVVAHHRALLLGTGAFEMALDRAGHVDRRLKRLAVVKAAMIVGCEFCIDIGTAEAAEAGIPDDQIRALSDFEESEAFSEVERLVLQYTVALTVTPTEVPDQLFDALAGEFDEAELVELTAAIAFENYRARFHRAFGIAPQGFAEDEFCPRSEEPPSLLQD